MKTVTCACCGSDRYRAKYLVGDMRLVQCTGCGLCYFNPRLEDEEIFDIYRGDYFENRSFFRQQGFIYGYQDYLGDRPNIRQDFERKLEKIEGYAARGRVLDVGCAHGFFLELMKERGFETEGVELNPQAVEFARRLGLDVREGAFEDAGYAAESFDLVTMFDLIEHLRDPRAGLEKARAILKPGGVLVVGTVDIDSSIARWLGPRWEDVRRSRTHLWLFSRRTMQRMAEASGFETLEVTSCGKVFELGFALRRAAPYSPRMFNALCSLTGRVGIDRTKVYVDVRSKLCYYLKKAKA